MKSAMVAFAIEQSLGQFVRTADQFEPESDESLLGLAKGKSKTDPLIEKPEFHNVREAYISSEAGVSEASPDEWLEAKVFQLPNNLPNKLEHSITSLIGRNSEKANLTKTILSPRVPMVAVVAPGGIGKTALILDVLKDLSTEPGKGNYIDGIVFISLKQEFLTTKEVVSQHMPRPESIDELRNELVGICNQLFALDHIDSFSKCVETLKSKRLLICLDNVESIVLYDQEGFRDFHLALPDTWKICLISRISIDGALTITLRGKER